VGSDWVQDGVRGSRAARCGALTSGPGSTMSAGQVLNLIQTDSNNSKWFKWIKITQVWSTQKVLSLAPKIRNKILLERACDGEQLCL
jgi:hypothetical protein